VAGTTFDAFYTQHYVLILRFAERRIDGERAEDVAAETFAIAWKKFDAESPPGLPWLYQTARNLIGNAYRRRGREQRLVERLEAEALASAPAGEFDLLEALQALNPKYRDALQLTYWEGLSAAQIAEVVGCSEAAAWKRISRGKEDLKRMLDKTSEEARVG
jgi:RNA polymerase sigma-70 factor (ECF subfamily)